MCFLSESTSPFIDVTPLPNAAASESQFWITRATTGMIAPIASPTGPSATPNSLTPASAAGTLFATPLSLAARLPLFEAKSLTA